jgi:hypothetical protein
MADTVKRRVARMVDNIRSLPESIFLFRSLFFIPDASSCRPAVLDTAAGIFGFSVVRVQRFALAAVADVPPGGTRCYV